MEKITITRNELLLFAENNSAFAGLDLTKFSLIFLGQLYKLYIERVVCISNILDAVKLIEESNEGLMTKKADQFKHAPLKGLWKKHFFDPCFLMNNIIIQNGCFYGGSKYLKRIIEKSFDESTSDSIENIFKKITYESTVKAYESRASKNKLTGEWIIFHKEENENYFLCLASHRESDDDIYKRVCMACEQDFPFCYK